MIYPIFEEGNHAFAVILETTRAPVECPDCLRTLNWHVTLPTGEEFDIKCQTCTFGYETRGHLESCESTGRVVEMTIGSIRIDTASHRDKIEYMCEETGIGIGRVWSESDLYVTREHAEHVLPGLVEAHRIQLQESRARSIKLRRDDSRAGGMAAFYRKQIRLAKKDIAPAEEGLAREARKAAK